MLLRLFLLFTIVPVVELSLLIFIGRRTSLGFTLGLVLTTGLVGAALARWQGWQTWQRIQTQLGQGQMPADSLVDGVIILIAGTLLITPGILTDCAGFCLLIPVVRRRFKTRLWGALKRRAEVRFTSFRSGAAPSPPPDAPRDTEIDADFTRLPPDDESQG